MSEASEHLDTRCGTWLSVDMLEDHIENIRDSVVAVARARISGQGTELGILGTAWCIVPSVFLTAHHVFNNGQPRNVADQFILLRAKGNRPALEGIPVTGFPLEDEGIDLAAMSIPSDKASLFDPIEIDFGNIRDGLGIFTYGYPGASIQSATTDPSTGLITAMQTKMFSRANDGIVSAQYDLGGMAALEVNVAWFKGESGGPILKNEDGKAIGVMKSTRYLSDKDGADIPGPRIGTPLRPHETTLRNLIDSNGDH